jgi:hypothetical protein
VLGVAATSWIAVEAAATALGYPGTSRFLVLPAALVCVLAGAGAVWLVQTVPRRAWRTFIAVALAAAALPFVLGPVQALQESARASIARARFERDLRLAVARAGGPAALRSRGGPVIPAGLWWNAGALAWDLRVPLERINTIPNGGLATLRGCTPRRCSSRPWPELRPTPPPGHRPRASPLRARGPRAGARRQLAGARDQPGPGVSGWPYRTRRSPLSETPGCPIRVPRRE